MEGIEHVKLRCPQPSCEGEMEVSNPEYLEGWEHKGSIANVRPSWRCTICALRILASNPNVLVKGTEYRVHRHKVVRIFKYSDAGSGLWIPKDAY